MQTFLPYESFEETANCLDYRRLGKQRVEAYQILLTLLENKTGWTNHPAVKMWKGHEGYLLKYLDVICNNWKLRGFSNTKMEINYSNLKNNFTLKLELTNMPTAWIGNEKFHASHRSNLLRKLPEHYSKFGWTESNNLEYVWPL
jgi:hypothetical protein